MVVQNTAIHIFIATSGAQLNVLPQQFAFRDQNNNCIIFQGYQYIGVTPLQGYNMG